MRSMLITAAFADHQKSTRVLAYSVDFWRSENCFGMLNDCKARARSAAECWNWSTSNYWDFKL